MKMIVVKKGERYGNLTVIKEEEPIYHPLKPNSAIRIFRLKCDCGNETIVRLKNLRHGRTTKSCGCLQIESTKKANTLYPNKKLLAVWYSMWQRCYRKDHHAYERYGARGINICEEWLGRPQGVLKFIEWSLKNGYKEGLEIDRKNNDKGYSPFNCRWVTCKVNQNNRSSNHFVKHKGNKYSFTDFWNKHKQNGVLFDTALKRVKSGISPIKAVTVPPRPYIRRI